MTRAEPVAAQGGANDDTRGTEQVVLGRNQFDLLTNALEGLLALLVEDWRADVPVGKDPWDGAGLQSNGADTRDVWNAIGQARGVLAASEKWIANVPKRCGFCDGRPWPEGGPCPYCDERTSGSAESGREGDDQHRHLGPEVDV